MVRPSCSTALTGQKKFGITCPKCNAETNHRERNSNFYVLDAYEVAKETGMGRRINTIMQTGFFALSGVLPQDEAIAAIKQAIKKTYSKRGEAVVEANYKAVDGALAHMHKVDVPAEATSTFERPPIIPEFAPEFVKSVTARIIEGVGDAPASLCHACGRHLPHRHHQMGKTEHLHRNSGLGSRYLYPVW